jgi:hypothetical protein
LDTSASHVVPYYRKDAQWCEYAAKLSGFRFTIAIVLVSASRGSLSSPWISAFADPVTCGRIWTLDHEDVTRDLIGSTRHATMAHRRRLGRWVRALFSLDGRSDWAASATRGRCMIIR